MDDQNIPRRLRRFLRKGEPIPENLLPKNVPDNEPWNQPAVTAQAKSNMAISARAASAEEAMKPRHRGKRFQEMQERAFTPAPATPIDKAIGLEKKSQFQERLPSSGNKAIEMKKTEIQRALEDIKRFRESTSATTTSESIDQMAEHIAEQNKSAQQKQEEKGLSFHFTPMGAAPNPVDPKKLASTPSNEPSASATASPIPIPDLSKLSARERMEYRKQLRGQSVQPSSSAAGNTTPPSARAASSPTPPSTESRSHIRRRMGQVDASTGGNDSPATTEEENMTPEAEADFKDLFADEKTPPKKKKMSKPASEDEELDSEEDMELFEEEK